MTTCQIFANNLDTAEHLLTDITVHNEPDGSKTFDFTYSGNVANSYVAFGLVSFDASRLFKVKFGQIETDTVTVSGATTPVGTSELTPGVQKISVPADAAPKFEQGWIAEMTVNGKHAGRCSSPAGFEKEFMAKNGTAGSARTMN